MTNYRSLVPGGFFSSDPTNKSLPVSIRMNNPGAINGSSKWVQAYPGFVMTSTTTPGNATAIFEAPEYGAGAWWNVLNNYRTQKNVNTVGGIINAYGGGQDYSAYAQFVLKQTGFSADTVIDLNNDQQLLQLGLAQFRYESGEAPPWSNDQILYGIRGGRAHANTGTWPASPPVGTVTTPVAGTPATPAPTTGGQMSDSDLLALLQKLIVALAASAGGAKTTPSTITPSTTMPATNQTTVPPILSSIDQLIGGQGMVGYKTMFGVLGYALTWILKAGGVLGAATPAGQILPIIALAFAGLGALAKIDRMTQAMGTIAANSTSGQT